MKIIHINFSFKVGGLETMLVDILNEQSKSHIVKLIIINNQYETQLLNGLNECIEVIKINRPEKSSNIFYIIKLNLILLYQLPDVIHCHNHKLINLFFSKIYKVYLTIHDMHIISKNILKYKSVFAISESVKKDLEKRYNINCILIYNGILINKIEEKYDYSNKPFFKIVQISRLQLDKKGQHILLYAIHTLVHKYNFHNVILDFIGEGESITTLKEITNNLQLKDQVNFIGLYSRQDVYKRLKNYSLLVQPSLFEGFGLTIVESMVAGVPVLVSNIDGPLEIVQDEKYGYIFESNNAESCANRIKEIIQSYDSYSFQEKLNVSKQYARSMFNIKRTAKEYLNHY